MLMEKIYFLCNNSSTVYFYFHTKIFIAFVCFLQELSGSRIGKVNRGEWIRNVCQQKHYNGKSIQNFASFSIVLHKNFLTAPIWVTLDLLSVFSERLRAFRVNNLELDYSLSGVIFLNWRRLEVFFVFFSITRDNTTPQFTQSLPQFQGHLLYF